MFNLIAKCWWGLVHLVCGQPVVKIPPLPSSGLPDTKPEPVVLEMIEEDPPKLQPPVRIARDDLDRAVDTDKPVRVVDDEDAKAAAVDRAVGNREFTSKINQMLRRRHRDPACLHLVVRPVSVIDTVDDVLNESADASVKKLAEEIRQEELANAARQPAVNPVNPDFGMEVREAGPGLTTLQRQARMQEACASQQGVPCGAVDKKKLPTVNLSLSPEAVVMKEVAIPQKNLYHDALPKEAWSRQRKEQAGPSSEERHQRVEDATAAANHVPGFSDCHLKVSEHPEILQQLCKILPEVKCK